MLQQQAQLQQLQSQQQNIHMLIAKQRQNQWGGQAGGTLCE